MIIEDGGGYLNRLIWARPEGELHHYDKRHLFRMAGEEKVYRAGEKHLTVDLRGWKIRPFVCYDLRFPIWTRNIDNAYDAAIFVANWPAPRSGHWRKLLAARAIENQAYVIGANRVGTDGDSRSFIGDSAVFDPGGEALLQMDDVRGIQTVRLSAEALTAYRESFPAWMDADRGLVSF
jgi:predicted amidohydrolase